MKKLVALAVGLAFSITSAHAVVFQFKGDGGLYDVPIGNIAMDCGTLGVDICSDDDALGLTYSKGGFEFTATATANDDPTELIQDIAPDNSGLGALSEGDNLNDQTQFDSGEVISFLFTTEVLLSQIEFNAGNDTDCSNPGAEGPCGDFNLYIDDVFVGVVTAVDLITDIWKGTKFVLEAITPNAGFVVAQFEVNEVPIPAALPLLLSGLAGLGFASRRKKKVA